VKYWFAVQTKPRQETVAEENLARQGYHSYLPKVRVRKRRRGKWVKVVEPLFPRYLFIQVDPDKVSLAPVRSTLGVAALVRFGQQLKPVPDEVIDYLLQAEDPDTHQHLADQWPHQPGDTVRVLEGPFNGLSGIFQSVSGEGEGRALLLIELLGRQNTVQVSMDALSAGAENKPR
jgi:transcriptional antiterminator RfaH